MASTSKCAFCGAVIRSDEERCPSCGAVNDNYVPETPRSVFLPKTIEELKEYCAERGMPLQRMRFFIGTNYTQPKAFGIYKDGDRFVVYKNKANGNRAIRYHGPDEAYAINELFLKLLQECHNRGIYPDGKPQEAGSAPVRRKRTKGLLPPLIVIVSCLVLTVIIALAVGASHSKDGYYRSHRDDTRIFYRYGSRWYASDIDGSWYQSQYDKETENSEDYLGKEYESGWGGSDFKRSAVWERIQEDHSSSSSDYDSWDSNDTDWDSDW